MSHSIQRTVTYQTGVDVLGFPVYIEHQIIQDNPKKTRNKKGWLWVYAKLIKQH